MSVLELLVNLRKAAAAELLSHEEVERLRKIRFRRLLLRTVEESPFYRTYYADHGIKRRDLAEVPLEELPRVNKSILMEHFNDVVTDSAVKLDDVLRFADRSGGSGERFHGKYHVIKTSGSTGQPAHFLYDESAWTLLRAMVISRLPHVPLNPLHRQHSAFFGVIDGAYAGISLAASYPPRFFKFLPLSITRPLDEIRSQLNAFQPNVISGYNSGLGLLAQEQRAGRLHIAPSMLIGSADPLTAGLREEIKAAFGVEPFNLYAASESIGIGLECEQHRGFHAFSDWYCLETKGCAAASAVMSGSGALVLTNLFNHLFPLIRYEMKDELVFDTEPCPCGRPFPLIKQFSGRVEDFLWFNNGRGGAGNSFTPRWSSLILAPACRSYRWSSCPTVPFWPGWRSSPAPAEYRSG